MALQAIYVKYHAVVKRTLGKQELQMLAYLQLRRQRTVCTGELTAPLGISREQERELFRRMARGGLIARVRRGLYLVPAHLPLGGAWSPDEALALSTLLTDRGGRYQICGPSAFHQHGLDGQVPNRVFVYNDRISGRRTIGTVALSLIKVAPERLGDTEEVRTAEGEAAVYSSRTRTLLDGVYDWSRFGSLPRAYGWIRGDLAAGRVDAAQLVGVAVRYGDVGTRRRLGALLDREGVEVRHLRRLERSLRTTRSTIPWDPTRAKRGTLDHRWGVIWNEA